MSLCREPWMVAGLALLFVLGFSSVTSARGRPQDDGKRAKDQQKPNETPPGKAEKLASPRGDGVAHPDQGRQQGRSPNREAHPRAGRSFRSRAHALDGFNGEMLDQAYRQGVADGRNIERFEIQAERGLAAYQEAMFSGDAAFAKGKYGLAARQFLLAATLNQGDPAARICAAHAETALSNYGPAVRLLRRAFELQPMLVYLPLDIRGAYGDKADFVKHRGALQRTAVAREDNGNFWLLLGYYHYYTDNLELAADALEKAVRLQPEDPLAVKLAALARTSAHAR